MTAPASPAYPAGPLATALGPAVEQTAIRTLAEVVGSGLLDLDSPDTQDILSTRQITSVREAVTAVRTGRIVALDSDTVERCLRALDEAVNAGLVDPSEARQHLSIVQVDALTALSLLLAEDAQ